MFVVKCVLVTELLFIVERWDCVILGLCNFIEEDKKNKVNKETLVNKLHLKWFFNIGRE